MTPEQPVMILVADDDSDDRLLIADAFAEARLASWGALRGSTAALAARLASLWSSTSIARPNS